MCVIDVRNWCKVRGVFIVSVSTGHSKDQQQVILSDTRRKRQGEKDSPCYFKLTLY